MFFLLLDPVVLAKRRNNSQSKQELMIQLMSDLKLYHNLFTVIELLINRSIHYNQCWE